MRKNLTFLLLFVFIASALFAAEHRISILGTGSSFYRPPLKTPADVQKMVTAKKADMQMILEKRGWTGKMDDLVNAVAAGNITSTKIERGANLPFMANRHHGKPSYMENVVWMGRKAFEAFLVEFDSNGYSYRLYLPKPCGNFWIEGKPSSAPTQPVGDKPSVRVDTPEACITQAPTVHVMVSNAAAGSNVQLSVDGQNVMTFAATNGTTEKQLTAYTEAGSHSISVTLDGAESPATGSLTVKACPPSCNLAALPPTVKRKAPVSIDVSGSQVASGVSVGMKSVSVEILKDQTVVDSFDLTAPNLKRDDYKFKKSGMYTVRATAMDNAGQKSTNACEAQVEVPKPKNPFFVAGFVGKERLVREEFEGGRCAPLIGFKGGIIPEIKENLELELSIGGKINTRDTDNSSIFADVALNGVMDRWFIGGGVSFWDLTISDTRTVAALVQTGFNLDQDGRFQFAVEGRVPFDQFDDIDNNYQVWAGIRFRPGR